MVVRLFRALYPHIKAHFEVGFYVYLWVNGSALAALVGRPWLGAIGLVTVAPFVVAYVVSGRRGRAPG